MSKFFLPGFKVNDLSEKCGNGPFGSWGPFLGVILHVNVDEKGTSDSFWGNNPDGVCPNYQVYKDGSGHQLLPFDWQPACQREGNYQYAAIETAGMPDEPLTQAQLKTCARIVLAYHLKMGMPLKLADKPGEKGLGTHQMGGESWGGHACPGPVRSSQRSRILTLAKQLPVEDNEWSNNMTEDQLNALIDLRVTSKVSEALRAFGLGEPSATWNHKNHPYLVPSDKNRGVLDRLHALEVKRGK